VLEQCTMPNEQCSRRTNPLPYTDDGGLVARNFFDVDPTAFCGHPGAHLSGRRVAYITGLRVQPITQSPSLPFA